MPHSTGASTIHWYGSGTPVIAQNRAMDKTNDFVLSASITSKIKSRCWRQDTCLWKFLRSVNEQSHALAANTRGHKFIRVTKNTH